MMQNSAGIIPRPTRNATGAHGSSPSPQQRFLERADFAPKHRRHSCRRACRLRSGLANPVLPMRTRCRASYGLKTLSLEILRQHRKYRPVISCDEYSHRVERLRKCRWLGFPFSRPPCGADSGGEVRWQVAGRCSSPSRGLKRFGMLPRGRCLALSWMWWWRNTGSHRLLIKGHPFEES
jgi:hypothetical protein